MKQEAFDYFHDELDVTLLEGQWSDILELVNPELQAENKALKGELDKVRKAGIGTLFELRKVQAIRDELLGVWKEYLKFNVPTQEGFAKLADSFQKAEQQKEPTGITG